MIVTFRYPYGMVLSLTSCDREIMIRWASILLAVDSAPELLRKIVYVLLSPLDLMLSVYWSGSRRGRIYSRPVIS